MFTLAASLFGVTYVQVFLRAFQQKNVINNKYKWVTPVSFGMAACEIMIIVVIVDSGLHLASVIGMGLGGGTGCMSAMWCHNWLSNRKNNEVKV